METSFVMAIVVFPGFVDCIGCYSKVFYSKEFLAMANRTFGVLKPFLLLDRNLSIY